jgi:putative salt-induced outer membrane protein YdiY
MHLPLMADEIRMKNGDRITGDIVRMERERLILKTSYTDENLSISSDEVDCVSSSRDLTVELTDYEVLVGPVACPGSGTFRVDSPRFGPSRELPLQEVRAINPSIYSGLFTLGSNFTSGNTETAAAALNTRFRVRTKRHRFTVDARYNYGRADGETSVRNSSASLKYDNFIGDKLYSYAQSLTEEDSFANLNMRNTEGLGLGWQFFDSRRLSLFTEAGISYFNEDVKVGEDRQDAALRWAAEFDWEAVPKRLRLYHRQEGYYDPDASSVVLRADQGVRIPLVDNFSANFSLDYRYNSKPEGGKDNSDTTLNVGVTYEYAYW